MIGKNKSEENNKLIGNQNNQYLELSKKCLTKESNSNRSKQSLIQLHQCFSPNSSNSKSKPSLSRLKTDNYNYDSNNEPFQIKKTISKSFREDEGDSLPKSFPKNNGAFNNKTKEDSNESSGYENDHEIKAKEEDPNEKANRKIVKRDKICDTDTEDSSASDDTKSNKWIILPDCLFKRVWNFIIALSILYSAIVTPYSLAFQEGSFNIEQYFEYGIDGIILVDIVLNFFSAYNDKDENLIKKPKKIIKTYLKSWFVLDLLSVFPFTLFTKQTKYNLGTLSRISRLPKLYKLFKLTKLIRITKMTKTGNVSSLTKVFLEKLKMNSNIEKLLYFFLTFLLLSHLSTCIWYFVAKMEDFSPDSWVVRLGYIDSTNFQIYVLAFYWTLTTVTTVGYGDISAGTTPERIYNIFIMSFGVLMYSFAIGSLSYIVAAMDRKTAEMNQKLNILTSIKKEFNLGKTLYDKVRKVIKFDLSRNQRDKMQFLRELPNKLRIELSQIMHDKVIQNLNFFRDQPNDFFAYVASLLKPVKFCQNDYLYKTEDLIEEMYFISKGTIIFCLDKNYSEKEIIEIKKSNNFGEIEMCLLEKLRFNIKVKSRSCELFVLKKNDFLRLSVNFKDFIEKFLHKSLMVYLKYNEKRKKIIEEYESLMVKIQQQGLLNDINTNDNNEALLIGENDERGKGGDTCNDYDDLNQSDTLEDLDVSYLNSKKTMKTEELKKKMNFALVESKLINSQFTSKQFIKETTKVEKNNQNEIQMQTINSNDKFQKKIEAIIEYLESNGIVFPDSESNPKILFEELKNEADIDKREVLVSKIEASIKNIYH